MSINPDNEVKQKLTLKSNKPTIYPVLREKSVGFLFALSLFGIVLVLYNLYDDINLGYGKNKNSTQEIGNNDLKEQVMPIIDYEIKNIENPEQNKTKFLDYEIKKGDTLIAIANTYDLKVKDILSTNGLTAKSIIRPGQKLKLPTKTALGSNSEKIDSQSRAVVTDIGSEDQNPKPADNGSNNLEDDDKNEQKPFDYEVESGDTISSIAEKYNLKITTILWANNLTAKSVIKPGQKLLLLPVDGVLYTIKRGETIGEVAKKHKANAEKTIEYNDIEDPTRIHPGDVIIIPGGQPLPPPPKPQYSKGTQDSAVKPGSGDSSTVNLADKLLWPTTTKRITQGYKAKHRGIDIANGSTPPIFASHAGVVEFAGPSGSWGNTILIRRADGLVTRYSHALEIWVTKGQAVNTGDTIGKVGTTGRSTGYHLDFRVYIKGVATNPMKFF